MKNQAKKEVSVHVTKNGPYIVRGNVPIHEVFLMPNENKEITEYREGEDKSVSEDCIALCRCGKSKNKPFCDGEHQHACFDGTETASKTPLESTARKFSGPHLTLYDNEKYCAFTADSSH